MTQDVKKTLKISGLAIFFIVICIYAFFQARYLILGVKIKDVNIVDGSKVTDNVLKLNGNAKNAVSLTIDGRTVSLDQDGNFNETVVLLSGYNIINMRAVDKFGHVDEKNYQLIY